MSCPHPEMESYRQSQQETHWKSLGSLQTPPTLLEYICNDITNPRSPDEYNLPENKRSIEETHTTLPREVSALCHEAYIQQSEVLGWDNFLRGRISILWGESFFQASMARQHWADKRGWASKVINLILQYSSSLWYFRRSLIHGRTVEESKQKIFLQLQVKVEAAYIAYSANLFVVDYATRNIFLVPLPLRLRQDIDSLRCFLQSYDLATERQALL